MAVATKKHIIESVSRKTGLTQVDVRNIFECFLDAICDNLVKRRQVHIRGFGIFKVIRVKPRVGRNLQTGEAIHIPARDVPKFKFSQKILDVLK